MRASRWLLVASLAFLGCSDASDPSSNTQADAGLETGSAEAAVQDAAVDSNLTDAGNDDAYVADTGDTDTGDTDAEGIDADVADAYVADANLEDVAADASPYSCPIELALTLQTATVDDLYDAIVAGDELNVLDVREPSETAAGIIEGAYMMPWTSGVLESDYASLPSDRPLYVICRSGNRSIQASTFLVNQGHPCVFNVQGGMNAWESAGYPTVAP